MTSSKTFIVNALWTDKGWIESATVQLDNHGIITSISAANEGSPANAVKLDGWVVPGLNNSHSHAFQFGMAGHAECIAKDKPADDFWSWRTAMYDLALSLDPDQFEKIAATVYGEMAKRGITSVVEFHYLHHEKDGRPYGNTAEMSERIASAAATARIRVTIVPIFYEQSSFGKSALPEQRRFIHSNIDSFVKLFEAIKTLATKHSHVTAGIGAHSLRGVKPENIVKLYEIANTSVPFHMHVAEQPAEVDACLKHLKLRPVDWVLKNLNVDKRCNLVHATHMTSAETTELAKSDATVVLCPSTEANLGDGVFPLVNFVKDGGRFSVGTDSQISLDLREDLRWLEYSARLTSGKRNPLIGLNRFRPEIETGELLMREVWGRGALSAGLVTNKNATNDGEGFAVGMNFDAIVIDSDIPQLQNCTKEKRLSTFLFATDFSAISKVIVGGNIL